MGIVDRYIIENSKVFDVSIEFCNIKSMSEFVAKMKKEQLEFQFLDVTKVKIAGEGVAAVISVSLKNYDFGEPFIEQIRETKGVSFVERM